MSPIRDELSEIEDPDKHDRHSTKLMVVSGNKLMIVSVYWFDLYHVMLGITINTNVFDSGKHGP